MPLTFMVSVRVVCSHRVTVPTRANQEPQPGGEDFHHSTMWFPPWGRSHPMRVSLGSFPDHTWRVVPRFQLPLSPKEDRLKLKEEGGGTHRGGVFLSACRHFCEESSDTRCSTHPSRFQCPSAGDRVARAYSVLVPVLFPGMLQVL